LLLLLLISTAILAVPAARGAYQIGDHVTNFSLRNCAGDLVSLYDYQGMVVFLTFWTPT